MKKQLLIIARKYNLSYNIIKSWYELLDKRNYKKTDIIIKNNIEIIKSKPFIKRVWWKRQLIGQFQTLFPTKFNKFHEPFLWWWSVFLSIQKKGSYLSDINKELINAWKVVKNNPYELLSYLETLKYDKTLFLEIRAWDRTPDWENNYSDIEKAGRFIYLNKTCFNWLYRVNKKWQFNVPFWRYKNPDFVQKENILNLTKLLNKLQVNIEVNSFEKVLEHAKKWDFVYFDPPYDVLTESANFTSYDKSWFWREKQTVLSNVCKELDRKWIKFMVSNHDTPFIRDIYNWFNMSIVKANRMINSKANKRWKVNEIVIRNY